MRVLVFQFPHSPDKFPFFYRSHLARQVVDVVSYLGQELVAVQSTSVASVDAGVFAEEQLYRLVGQCQRVFIFRLRQFGSHEGMVSFHEARFLLYAHAYAVEDVFQRAVDGGSSSITVLGEVVYHLVEEGPVADVGQFGLYGFHQVQASVLFLQGLYPGERFPRGLFLFRAAVYQFAGLGAEVKPVKLVGRGGRDGFHLPTFHDGVEHVFAQLVLPFHDFLFLAIGGLNEALGLQGEQGGDIFHHV